jgi:hypothetical protein
MLRPVNPSYAVIWCNGDRRPTGRLELGRDAVQLVGTAGGEQVREAIPYGDLSSVDIGRSPDERIDGRQTLVLRSTRRVGPLRIAGLTQVWIVSELFERLAALAA